MAIIKTKRVFKGSYFYLAAAIMLVVGELGAAWFTREFDVRNNPFLVGVVSVGLAAVAMSMIFSDSDCE